MRDLRKQHDKLCNKTLEQIEVKDPKGYYRSLKAFAGQEKSNQSLPTEMREGSALVGGIAALGKWKQGFQQLGKPDQADDPRFDKEFYRESHALVALWTQVQTAGPDELDGVITQAAETAVSEILKYAGPEMHARCGCSSTR